MAENEGNPILLLVVVIVGVTVLFTAIATFLTLGVLFGAGVAVHNYGLSFRENVKLEQPTT